MEYWGEMNPENGNPRPALIVSSFFDSRMEIANIVYVSSDEILYPVPRSLYRLSPSKSASMSTSLRNKMTTVLMEDTIVFVQVDPNTLEVNCMYKGGAMLGIVKHRMEWVMEVDVAVSDELVRRVFVRSAYLSATLVESLINLNAFKPNKPYKGIVKLKICHETVGNLAYKGIRELIEAQKAKQSCFLFVLSSIYGTEVQNMAVVYDAPWQSVKRSIVLTPAQVGDVPEDKVLSCPHPFHMHCIVEWTNTQSGQKCPLCRQEWKFAKS